MQSVGSNPNDQFLVLTLYLSSLLWTIKWPNGALQSYIDAMKILVRHTLIGGGGHPEWRDPAFCYFEWRDSGFGQNFGRESGFATSGGSWIKSFLMAGNGISRNRRDRNLDYFAIFWRDSKYYPFHPSIWLFRLADPKPQFTKETEFKHKHSLRTSAFISPFLGIILPFNRLSIIGSILHLRQTSLLCRLFSSIP